MPRIELHRARPNELLPELHGWFIGRGFRRAEFEGGLQRIVTHPIGQHLTFKLRERPGRTTFHLEAHGGALIVFEIAGEENAVVYDGYCPLLVFGSWERKLAFKREAGWLSKYRAEGYQHEQALLAKIRSVDQD